MRILIADDDATSRLVLKATASKLGHECLDATDGSSAWDVLSTERIDVLLTDWMMPGVDGPELCRRVRDELSDRYIYVVLITALGNREQVLEGMSAGADDYLIKPVDPFAVRTRLVAAERVTALHRQLDVTRAQLQRANLELSERALTDPLTGLGNRRRMSEDLARAHAHARRTGQTYAMAMFDIDHFKLYNDHYGHLAGDETLRQVAQCFNGTVRAGESIYRFGGEEFLLLLLDCTEVTAAAAADRVRRAVSDAALPYDVRQTTPAVVTISGGVACWTPGCAFSIDDLLQQADAALFQAKAAGRNRVHVAASPLGAAMAATG